MGGSLVAADFLNLYTQFNKFRGTFNCSILCARVHTTDKHIQGMPLHVLVKCTALLNVPQNLPTKLFRNQIAH